jgi:hypothetical protein
MQLVPAIVLLGDKQRCEGADLVQVLVEKVAFGTGYYEVYYIFPVFKGLSVTFEKILVTFIKLFIFINN